MFIRTDDNQIINVGKLKIDYDIKIVGNYLQVFYRFGITPIETYKIIKQADTIEELCDEFVIDIGNRKYLNHKGCYLGDFYKKSYVSIGDENIGKDEKRKIIAKYGAIWTDKGLIYVAKMNDKGELELL